MKLKYYLRGLGIGILVTSIIMGIALSHGKREMSDEEIKQRASRLGMVEEFTRLADTVSSNETVSSQDIDLNNIEPEGEEASTKENKVKQPKILEPKDNLMPEEEKENLNNVEQEPIKENNHDLENKEDFLSDEDKAEVTDDEEVKEVTLVVNSGDGSQNVARRAKDAGLVESAQEFDRYLCDKGYDKKLRVGSYVVKIGATMEEIAKKLTTQ